MGWTVEHDIFEEAKREADVLVSFDGFISVYMAFPEKFEPHPRKVLYINSDIHEYQSLGFATYKDFKRYIKWFAEKEKQAKECKIKERQDEFWKSVSNLFALTTYDAGADAAEAETTNFQAIELYTPVFAKVHVFQCLSCNRQFVHIPQYEGVPQQLNYCPLCGRKRK